MERGQGGMGQSERTPPPSLDELFKEILSDKSLQQQIKEAEEEQRRRLELEKNAPFIQAGRETYRIIGLEEDGFTEETQRTWDKLQKSYHLLLGDHPAVQASALHNYDNREAAYAGLLRDIIRVRGSFPDNVRWSRGKDAPANLRFFLFGYGKQAIEKGNVKAALIALDEGNWLDDKVEGPELQRKIGEKAAALTDPKAKVDAAMTWKGIQEAKAVAQPTPPAPPSSAPQP